jgi:hypothetical protein
MVQTQEAQLQQRMWPWLPGLVGLSLLLPRAPPTYAATQPTKYIPYIGCILGLDNDQLPAYDSYSHVLLCLFMKKELHCFNSFEVLIQSIWVHDQYYNRSTSKYCIVVITEFYLLAVAPCLSANISSRTCLLSGRWPINYFSTTWSSTQQYLWTIQR